MKLRKYTKVFKNRESANKFRDRMTDYAGRQDFDIEHYPQRELSFDDSVRRRRARYTVTYYLTKYNKVQKINEDDLYGSSASDATAKFKKAIVENFKNHKLVIRSVKLKTKHSKDFNLYTFRYYLKPRK